MSEKSAKRVQRHRDGMRAAGLRPVQIWAADTRQAGFADECRRQALLVRAAELETSTDEAWAETSDTTGWIA